MNEEIKDYLHSLAKNTIAKALDLPQEKLQKPPDSKILQEKRGVFVTLNLDLQLRGCIGYIMPIFPLEEAVKRNALNAAFDDPRFYPLTKEEFEYVKIEISVLTVPKKLEYKNADDLLEKLRPNIDGVILRKDDHEATYLPQVWENLEDKDLFLGSLCTKAGMDYHEWEKGKLEVLTYQAEAF